VHNFAGLRRGHAAGDGRGFATAGAPGLRPSDGRHDFRHLFPVKIAMRFDEPQQVDMVLGDGVRQRGAAAHEISEDTPGVAWAKIDGRRDPDRARAFHTTDTDLDELCDYIAAGRHDAPRPLTGIEAA